MKSKNKVNQITKLQMKFLLIISLALLSGCSHREDVDFPVGDRSYNIALINGHGYFVPVHTPDYLPPNPPPNFTPSAHPDFIPELPRSTQTTYSDRVTGKID